MTTTTIGSIPLACVPGAIPAAERPAHFALIQSLFGETLLETAPLPDGYGFRFPASALEALTRFVANERKCCPFLTFVMEIPPADGPVWLRLAGPEGTRAFLEAELPLRGGSHG